MATPERAPLHVGIDVAKDHLDIATLPSGEAWRVTNTPEGIDALVARLAERQVALVVMEGTGGHEHAVAAALAASGLAVAVVNPRQVRDSGRHRGQRIAWGGRAEVRSALYLAALASITRNPVIGGFYRRLVARGKPKKVALVAAMRKLLVMLNAMARDGERWDPDMVPLGT